MTDRKQQDIITEIRDLKDDADDLKGVQPLGGASFVNYTYHTQDAYDYSFNQSVSIRSFRLRFIYDDVASEKYHIVMPSLYYRIDNGNVMELPYFELASPIVSIDVLPEPSSPGESRWLLVSQNYDTPTAHNIYLKFYFQGTVSGTFVVESVWP